MSISFWGIVIHLLTVVRYVNLIFLYAWKNIIIKNIYSDRSNDEIDGKTCESKYIFSIAYINVKSFRYFEVKPYFRQKDKITFTSDRWCKDFSLEIHFFLPSELSCTLDIDACKIKQRIACRTRIFRKHLQYTCIRGNQSVKNLRQWLKKSKVSGMYEKPFNIYSIRTKLCSISSSITIMNIILWNNALITKETSIHASRCHCYIMEIVFHFGCWLMSWAIITEKGPHKKRWSQIEECWKCHTHQRHNMKCSKKR